MPLVDPEMKKKFLWPCIIGALIGVGMTPMLCFGIVCLSKGDEDSSCGPGGTGGGISMTVMASFIMGYMMGILTNNCKLEAF